MLLLANTAKLIRFLAALRIPGIREADAVVDESSATKILGNAAITEAQMIMTLPEAKIDMENVDAHREENAVIVWILSKGAGMASGKIVDIDEYLRLHGLMAATLEAFRRAIRESDNGACPYLAGMQIEQIVVTPEYNVFGGWNGWCATITIR